MTTVTITRLTDGTIHDGRHARGVAREATHAPAAREGPKSTPRRPCPAASGTPLGPARQDVRPRGGNRSHDAGRPLRRPQPTSGPLFMFGPDWTEGCPSCSFWADNFNGVAVHLRHRDVAFVAVSRVPHAQLDRYRERMGWTFDGSPPTAATSTAISVCHSTTINAHMVRSTTTVRRSRRRTRRPA